MIADAATLGGTSPVPGSMIGSDALLPAELIADLAKSATLRPLIHPADAPSERGYTPSRALADLVRCRDLTCRFPGCDKPAVGCDLDHTIPHRDAGPTHASNLKSLCRLHHLIKTFWGWHDQQLPDATIIWTSPSGQTYVTTPGSALLFPGLCTPTAALDLMPDRARCASQSTMMPKRRRSRAQNRANYIAAERRRSRVAQEPAGRMPLVANDEPPPF